MVNTSQTSSNRFIDNLPQTNKSLGQHWLSDPASLSAMCHAAELTKDDVILEIGPGIGTLTQLLVRQSKHVTAVEFDAALAHSLTKSVMGDNLTVVHQDILRFDLTAMPPDYKVVANIPYYLTSNLIRTLSETSNPPNQIVLLVQKEVAIRVAALPGNMSLLSVTAQYFWEVTTSLVVPAALFIPPPKVDSQILILKRRALPLYPDINNKQFFQLVKAGFASRRKTLVNSLSGGLRLPKPAVNQLLQAADVSSQVRPQELSIDDWHRIYLVVHTT